MVKRQKYFPLIFLGVAILATLLVSAGLTELEFSSGRLLDPLMIILSAISGLFGSRPQSAPTHAEKGYSLGLLPPIFWLALAICAVYAIVSPEYRKRLRRILVIVLLLSIILAFWKPGEKEVASTLEEPQEESGGEAAEGAEVDLVEPPTFVNDPPPWLLLIANAALALVILGSMWLVWRLLKRRPDTQTRLAQQAESALADIEAGGDLKNIVLRCYAKMSEVLRKSQHVMRSKAMTPREFENYLAETGLHDQHIQRLTRLFEDARYGAMSPTERTKREAIDCLRAIVRAFGKTS